MIPEAGNITLLLRQAGEGNSDAAAKLAEQVHSELYALARARIRLEHPHQSLSASALVNEAFLRMFSGTHSPWRDRSHFYRVAARVMRNVLVDRARRSRALKRNAAAERVDLTDDVASVNYRSEDLLALDQAMNELARMDPRLHQLVELRFFGGLSIEETAETMGLSPRTVKRSWQTARAWLGTRISPDDRAVAGC